MSSPSLDKNKMVVFHVTLCPIRTISVFKYQALWLCFDIFYSVQLKMNCHRIFFSLYTSDTLWSWLFPIINLCGSKVISFYEISLFIHYIYISSNIYHLTLWNMRFHMKYVMYIGIFWKREWLYSSLFTSSH